MIGKDAFLDYLKTTCKMTSKPKRHFKKGTITVLNLYYCTFLIVLHNRSCYHGVLQDGIAENKHVKEIVLIVAF